MVLKTLPRYLMNHAETITAGRRFCALFQSLPEQSPMFAELLHELQEDVERCEDAFGALKGDDLPLIQLCDNNRDEVLVKLCGYLRGLQHHFDSAIAQSATAIYTVLQNHDFGAKRAAYAEQTTVVNALLKDLQAENLQNHLSTCGVAPLIEELRLKQDAFETAILARIENSNTEASPAIRVLIEPLRSALDDLLSLVASRERLHPELYVNFIGNLNALITEIASTARSRNSRKEKAAATSTSLQS
jgi:hypothetical protein